MTRLPFSSVGTAISRMSDQTISLTPSLLGYRYAMGRRVMNTQIAPDVSPSCAPLTTPYAQTPKSVAIALQSGRRSMCQLLTCTASMPSSDRRSK